MHENNNHEIQILIFFGTNPSTIQLFLQKKFKIVIITTDEPKDKDHAALKAINVNYDGVSEKLDGELTGLMELFFEKTLLMGD
jgi:hypothetical protein